MRLGSDLTWTELFRPGRGASWIAAFVLLLTFLPVPLLASLAAAEDRDPGATSSSSAIEAALGSIRTLQESASQSRSDAREKWESVFPRPEAPLDDQPELLIEEPRPATSSWAPYLGSFGVAESGHLLRRTVIGPTWPEIESGATSGLNSTVATLLSPRFPPAPPGPWVFEPVPDVTGWTQEMIQELIDLYRLQDEMLRGWWVQTMVDQNTSVTETMVHFWHDHFATGSEKVLFPMSMYGQNALFRQFATGNFRELTRAVCYDAAMLLWLDGQVNRSGNINENFARELLELFTMGEGNYTQEDIVAVARCFTGWVTPDGITSVFVPEYHDYGYKVVLGEGGYWDGDDVIDIIFQQDATATYICEKLYRWFVSEYPDPARIAELAQILRDNDYEMAPVLETMLSSELFFDPDVRGAIVTDGVDHYAGLIRTLGMSDQLDLSDPAFIHYVFVQYSMYVYGHWLFDPPNVAGWDGYRTWVNSYTLPWRKTLDVALINGIVLGTNIQMSADVLAFAGQLQNPNDPYQLVDDIATLAFGLPPTELVRQRMLDELLQGAEPWEWSINDPNAASQLRYLLRLAFRLPDVQLK